MDAGFPGPSGICILEIDVDNLKSSGLTMYKGIGEYCISPQNENGPLVHEEFYLPCHLFEMTEFTETCYWKQLIKTLDNADTQV